MRPRYWRGTAWPMQRSWPGVGCCRSDPRQTYSPKPTNRQAQGFKGLSDLLEESVPSTTINRLFIDTPYGDRFFSLVHGNLCDESADLLIFSANAGSDMPIGAVVSALTVRFPRLDLDHASLVLQLGGHSPFRLSREPGYYDSLAGVYWIPPWAGTKFKGLLMVRIPNAGYFNSPLDAYGRAVRAVFAAAAALEFRGDQFPAISMSALGIRQDFPKQEAILVLLGAAEDWLRVSRHTTGINFVVLEDSECAAWNDAMNQALGRTFASDEGYAGAAAELRTRLAEQVDAVLACKPGGALGPVLGDLKQALSLGERDLSIQYLGMLGRQVAEAMAARLCQDLGLAAGDSIYGNIERLQKGTRISPWIKSYLHSLRTLGNESVHATEPDERIPNSLAAGDLVIILGNLARVLDFYRVWRQMRAT